MKREIETVIKKIGEVGGGLYLLVISLLSYYIILILKNLAGYSQPLPIDYLTIFVFTAPINIPLNTDTDTLVISLITLYTLFALYDTIRKVGHKRPIAEMFLLSSMIFVVSVGLEYIQDLIGVKTGYPKASNDYLYFISAIVAPITEEIGFRLTVIGLASLIIYRLMPLSVKRIENYIKAFFHPAAVFSENYIAKKMLYWIVIITSILFGLAHVISGGWEIGKITLAIVAGLLLGYLFIEYGFTTSVLSHAYFNIYLLALYFLYTLGDKGEFGAYSYLASYIGQGIYIFFSFVVGTITGIYYLYVWMDGRL